MTQVDFKSSAGPVSKSRFVDKGRTRPFLLRNLALILSYHEINQFDGATQASRFLEQHLDGHPDRNSWTMPTPAEVREAAKKNNQILRINLKGIQRSHVRTARSARAQQTEDREPGRYGTRKKYKIIDVPCTVEVNIWAGSMSEKSMYRERRAARLLGHKADDDDIHFETELVEGPFSISESNLEQLLENNAKYAVGIAGKFHIAIRLHFKNVEDSSQAISWIDSRPAPTGNGDWTLLEARWDRLPKCPADGEPLLLRRTDEVKLHSANREKDVGWRDTQSYLLVDMAWRNENADSPLAWCNKIRRRARLDPLPTPPISEAVSAQATPQKHVKLQWIFKDRKVETKGYRCGVCRRRNFTALDRLRFHVLTTHTNNDEVYYIENEDAKNIKIKVGYEQKIVGKNSKEPSTKPPKPGSKEEHIWITPNEKFDLTSFVKGKSRWQDKGYRIKRGRKGPLAPTSPLIHPTTIESRDLREIEPIPDLPKKRYKVPRLRAPDGRKLQIFSTLSRALVDPGDLLSESDDDPDTGYVEAKREVIFQTMSSTITEKQKTFMRVYDEHIVKENITADRYLADAIYRWVKTPGAEALLRDHEIQKEFEKKLKELREDSLIDKTVYQWCLQRSRKLANVPEDRAPSEDMLTPDEDIGRMVLDESGKYTDASLPHVAPHTRVETPAPVPKGREAGKCICGLPIGDMKTAVLCSNEDCLFPDHHMACVGIKSKSDCRGWLCADCQPEKQDIYGTIYQGIEIPCTPEPEPSNHCPAQTATVKTIEARSRLLWTPKAAPASPKEKVLTPNGKPATLHGSTTPAQTPGSKRQRQHEDSQDDEGPSAKRIRITQTAVKSTGPRTPVLGSASPTSTQTPGRSRQTAARSTGPQTPVLGPTSPTSNRTPARTKQVAVRSTGMGSASPASGRKKEKSGSASVGAGSPGKKTT
jgi:hypothetical protein